MRCPHCGHENVEGRWYCRGCAKPLAADAAPPLKPVPPAPPLAPTPTTVTGSSTVHPMAIACLALSVLASFLPLGIAAAVMGHISRSQIAKSNGKKTGTWLAFAGLVICYFQFFFVLLLAMGLGSTWHRMNENLDRYPDSRAALAEQFAKVRHPSAADAARHRQDAIDALRLISASEKEFFAAHLEREYSCDFYPMGWDATRDNELNLHIAFSRYAIKIYYCGAGDNPTFSAVAIPASDSNPPDAPAYCVDQTGVLRRFSTGQINEMNFALRDRQSCPQSGEVVE
jgi:hypothetical protein